MSTFNTSNIENLTGGAPDFSQGVNVGGTSITSLVNMTEFYDQAEEPSSPANGAVWWTGSVMYQYMNDAWRIVSVTPPPPWFGGRGLFAGGTTGSNSNVIDYLTIATTGNAVDFGDLTVARWRLSSCSNGSRGLFAGGIAASSSDVIDYVTIATTGNAVDFGDLTVARDYLASCSDGIYGLFGGGSTDSASSGVSATIDYVTIATTGNAAAFGDLTLARYELAACSDGIYGLFAGGRDVSGSTLRDIDYVTIQTLGNAASFGLMQGSRRELAACANETYGLFGGGQGDAFIDYVTIATLGSAANFGNLQLQDWYSLASCSDGVRGVFGGGQDRSDFPFVTVNVINYVTINTPGNALDFGDLTVSRSGLAACSGD
jgi:hypothetical protein